MVSYTKVTPEFAIGPQVSAEDFATLREAGFAAVLNARPDDEAGSYLVSGAAELLARAAGLDYATSPTDNHAIFEPEVIDRFEAALASLPKPVFAHCKSGTRAAILWALVTARSRPVDEVIALLRAAGQELEFLEDELREQAATARRSPFQLKDDAMTGISKAGTHGGKR